MNMMEETPKGPRKQDWIVLTPEQLKSRRSRNIAIALSVAAFMALFYVVTIVKLGGAVTRPPV
jgi:hypothetical protein